MQEEKGRSVRHWSEQLVEKLEKEKNQPYVITGGTTTSGTAHLGTIAEFLYSSVLRSALKEKGIDVPFHFVADILDAFDGVPPELKMYNDKLEPELGKPLCYVLDPFGCHASYGEHYLAEVLELMDRLGAKPEVVTSKELYLSGSFDKFAKLYLKEEKRVKEVVARTSLRKLEEFKNWSPIMPICKKCGKVATTMVTWHSEDEYEYTCSGDVKYVKGCGYKDKAKISDHEYKLQWRLHWPTWQAHFNSSIEGSGVDHMTRGGSADTAIAIHKEILNREPPILYKFGFFLFRGKKYSKSKGIGVFGTDIMKILPPEILKYIMIEPSIEQNKNIDPEGETLMTLYDDIERLDKLEKPESRADEKKLVAFHLSIKKLKWRAKFSDVLLSYQVYRDWDKVGERLGDSAGVKYLVPYISEWLSRGLEPERYNFEVRPQKIGSCVEEVKKFRDALKEGMSDLETHNLVYSIVGDDKKKAESVFAAIYTAMIGKESGPRLGRFVTALGIKRTQDLLDFAVS